MKIHTVGYAGMEGAGVLLDKARELDAMVVDVRLNDWSKRPEFQGEALRLALGEWILWVPEWGNVNYKTPERGFAIKDFEEGVNKLIQDAARMARHKTPPRNLLLLCGCARAEGCHRSLVAKMLGEWHPFPGGGVHWEVRGGRIVEPGEGRTGRQGEGARRGNRADQTHRTDQSGGNTDEHGQSRTAKKKGKAGQGSFF